MKMKNFILGIGFILALLFTIGMATAVPYAGGANLVINNVVLVPNPVVSGHSFAVMATIENNGTMDAIEVSFSVSTDFDSKTQGGNWIINAGRTTIRSAYLSVPQCYPAGDYDVHVIVEYRDLISPFGTIEPKKVEEIKQITVESDPSCTADVQINSIQVTPDPVMAGEDFEVDVEIENFGPEDATNVVVAFEVFADQISSAPFGLPAGIGTEQDHTFTVPECHAAGDYEVDITVTYDDDIGSYIIIDSETFTVEEDPSCSAQGDLDILDNLYINGTLVSASYSFDSEELTSLPVSMHVSSDEDLEDVTLKAEIVDQSISAETSAFDMTADVQYIKDLSLVVSSLSGGNYTLKITASNATDSFEYNYTLTNTREMTIQEEIDAMFNDIENQLNDYEDDFEDIEEDLEDARADNDEDEIEDLLDDLDDLEEDVEDLEDDEMDDLDDLIDQLPHGDEKDDYEDDYDDLKDDINDLLDDIDKLQSGEDEEEPYIYEPITPATPVTPTISDEDEVEVLTGIGGMTGFTTGVTATEPEAEESFTDTPLFLGILGAIALLVLVLIVMTIGLMFKRH